MSTTRKKCSAFLICTRKARHATALSIHRLKPTRRQPPIISSYLVHRLIPFLVIVFATADNAFATQSHGHPAGLYAHQIAHVFFLFSMGLLIFWLRHRGLIKSAGWRYIQYASLFFIFWNANAFLVHFVEEQMAVLDITHRSTWQITVQTQPDFQWLGYVYYVAKLDHLLCVPALVFLYIGLKRLLKESVGQVRRNV